MPTNRNRAGSLLYAVLLTLMCAGAAAAQQCALEYHRADNMWANWGRPDGPLGTEALTLQLGQTKAFVTDWRYEKQRNDGSNYYGSHFRVAANQGQNAVRLFVRGPSEFRLSTRGATQFVARTLTGLRNGGYAIVLRPGERVQLRHDLVEASCLNES